MTGTEATAGSVIEKPWGTSRLLFADASVRLVEIAVRRGGYCSRHRHQHQDNALLVVRGRLLLICFEPGGPAKTILNRHKGLYTVAAGMEHRFVCLEEDTLAYEVYYARNGGRPDEADIVRCDESGSLRTVSALPSLWGE